MWSSTVMCARSTKVKEDLRSLMRTVQRGFFSTVMFVGSAAAMGTTLRGIQELFMMEWRKLYYLYYYLYIILVGLKHVGNDFTLRVIFVM